MQDIFGKQVGVGDLVAFAALNKKRARMRAGTVERFHTCGSGQVLAYVAPQQQHNALVRTRRSWQSEVIKLS